MKKCHKSLEECNCYCHTGLLGLGGKVHHVAPCCKKCPTCKKKISKGWYEIHMRNCGIPILIEEEEDV